MLMGSHETRTCWNWSSLTAARFLPLSGIVAPFRNNKGQKRIESSLVSVRGCSGLEWCVRCERKGRKKREEREEKEERGCAYEPQGYSR